MSIKMEILIQFFCKYTSKSLWNIIFGNFLTNISYTRSHVQISNEGAIDFYKKFGFEIVETKQHYYKRIEPADAHVLQKTLRPRANQTNQQTIN